MDTITLYRPVGGKELELIREAGSRAFPPRLPDQPIFYPVLSQSYAAQIARDWNSKLHDDGVGYVTAFDVLADYLARHEVKQVGGADHREYWIPAEELPEFNASIVGEIRVVDAFRNGAEVAVVAERG